MNRRGTMAVQVAVAVLLLAGCAAGATSTASASRTAAASASSPVPASPSEPGSGSQRPTPAPTRSTPRPGPSVLPVETDADAASEPQTKAFPQVKSVAFGNATHDIWLAITTGDPDYAKPAFFPEKAYEQIKAIANPASDWQNRLWYDFTLDVAAAHKLVKPGATLVKVDVPAQYAQWIPPGACYNSAGYWHVPGSRVVYRQAGTTLSFGIASFISWRGTWYLIHLGALTRGGAYGIVDDPEHGPGIAGPPGGC